MTAHRTLLAAAVLALAATTARAQMPESYRAVQMRALETQRRMLLSFADSMPERFYRVRATPSQRDFAQQVAHAAVAVPNLVAGFLGGPRPSLPDTASSYATRAGLRALINASFDHAVNALRNQPAAERELPVTVFGNVMTKWQLWDEINIHTYWTAGQIVANFRNQGMAPPSFLFF